ncbi:hypothetical protein O77CONTIG1_03051 [Leptolyngbya sp. O-77]|nr:hypothetical protein O77CONTIG1_03051 [Leptolyngbya sp. O-77]
MLLRRGLLRLMGQMCSIIEIEVLCFSARYPVDIKINLKTLKMIWELRV